MRTGRHGQLAAVMVVLATIGVSPPVSAEEADGAFRLQAPRKGKINVAFVIGPRATVIDFTGPWEVFQDVHVEGRGESHDEMMPFRLYTVADSTEPVEATGGLMIVPDYSFDDAPQPDVIVVPAVRSSGAMLDWLRKASRKADVTTSVCTGAFVVAKAGLLDGKQATTHHQFLDNFEKSFPAVAVQRGKRFVENDGISTAGGLTSGIDLALRVVERYFGREVAARTASYMEYESKGWIDNTAKRMAAKSSAH